MDVLINHTTYDNIYNVDDVWS